MNIKRHAVLSWLFVAVLVGLCAILGVLQYRWIGEVSRAERDRLRSGLNASLQRISQDFNEEINTACVALLPPAFAALQEDIEGVYAGRYMQWQESSRHSRLFRRVARAVPADGSLQLRLLDSETGMFSPMEWPPAWEMLHNALVTRLSSGPPPPFGSLETKTIEDTLVIDLPRFHPPGAGGGLRPGARGEADWLLVELDLDYLRSVLLPELLARHLGKAGQLQYQVSIAVRGNPSAVVYTSTPDEGAVFHEDASTGLFEVSYDRIMRRDGPQRRGPREAGSPPPVGTGRGRWMISARHHAGSVEAVVNQARRRNLAVTAAVLVLMLAAIAALIRYTRRAQRLAELQMEFVAGVSHELRTPLSVIRTAGHNLSGGLISSSKQIERYGALIQEEAEKLTDIVEQVLRFSSINAGRVIHAQAAVSVDTLIRDSLDGVRKAVEESRCVVEQRIEPGLPPVLGDATALRHAVQNLVSNAAKYGSEGRWIGVSASRSKDDAKEPAIEIRVSDRGLGIPADELESIFDPFYRGSQAVADQIHGTGLGLTLVKRIVEAHRGSLRVVSKPGKGTEFVLLLPPVPAEQMDEFADTADRR